MSHRPKFHLLFVCSKNEWRSPTAERMYRDHPGMVVRSRGTNRQARQRVTSKDIVWADVVLVMESKHRWRILQEFSDETLGKEIHVLNIPDEYHFMDPDLINELAAVVTPILSDRFEK